MNVSFKHICVAFLLLSILLPGLSGQENLDPRIWRKALSIHWSAVVIDTHCDTPMDMLERGRDIGVRSSEGDVDLVRMTEGGVDASFFAVYVSNRLDNKNPSQKAMAMIKEIYRQVERNSGKAVLAFSPRDIKRLHNRGKRAILIGMENGGPIEGKLDLLRDYYDRGVRYVTLTHNDNNDICDSATAEKPKWNGLSPFGKEVVKEMNRLGMLIDVSHVSDKTFWDVVEVSRAPVFASHSSARAVCDVPRNMSDDMIKALAKKGGVIQVTFASIFLDNEYSKKADAAREKIKPQRKKLREKYKDKKDRSKYWNEYRKLWKQHAPPDPPIGKLIDHIDHVVGLVGVDHVGLGSDYDGTWSVPQGLGDIAGFPRITYHLLKRGYSSKDIHKILGGNFLRVFQEVVDKGEKK